MEARVVLLLENESISKVSYDYEHLPEPVADRMILIPLPQIQMVEKIASVGAEADSGVTVKVNDLFILADLWELPMCRILLEDHAIMCR